MKWRICICLLLGSSSFVAPARQKRQFRINLGDLFGAQNNNNQQQNSRNGGIDLGGILNTIVRPQPGRGQGGTTGNPNILGNIAGQLIGQAIKQTDVQLGVKDGQLQVAVLPKQPSNTATTAIQDPDCSGASGRRPSVGVRSGDLRCGGGTLNPGCEEVNVNYGGNDISGGVSRQQSWQRCKNRCGTNARCTHWTFRKSDGFCWLKTGNNAKTRENGLVSGPRNCQGGGSSSSRCMTVGGGDTGASCVFPFIFKDKSYSGCTLADAEDGLSWCSTLVDSDGVHVGGQGKWGHCAQSCRRDSGSAVSSGFSSNNNNKEVLPEGSISASGLKKLPWFPSNGKLNLPLDTVAATNDNVNAGDIKNRFLGLGLNQPNNGHGACRVNAPGGKAGQIRHLHHCIQPIYFNFFTFLANIRIIQGRYIGVCCPDPVTNSPAPTSASTPAPTPAPTAGPVPIRSCGVNAKKFQTRIVGGRPADPDEWPWLAALVRPGGRGSGQYCGATLISNTHVLTAAHCLAPFQAHEIRVKLGEYDFDQTGETGDETFRVLSMKMHENYNDVSYENDIAIIKLDRPATLSKSIWPVCLPPAAVTFENRRAFVIGWGTIYFGGPTSSTLQEVNVRVWDQQTCKNNYNKLSKTVTEDMLCAGEQNRDSCQGDSGGPLNCLNPSTKKWELCGVVSWGAKCAEPDFPGVYTRVTKYLDWIQNNSI